MAPKAKNNFNQLSVSAHSFLAISNFECISARLCGYWASVMFAKTLDEDFLIWKTVLESILYSEQSFAILIANSSLYSKSKFFFAIVIFLAFVITAEPWMESATCCGMESMRSIVWNQERRETENTACRLMPCADEPQFHTICCANWCHTQALRSWIKQPKPTPYGFDFGCFLWSLLNESRTTNEITYGDEILVSLGWNLRPAASDEIKSANLTSRKRDLIALAISSTYVDLFRISGFSWKNLTLFGGGFFWWSIGDSNPWPRHCQCRALPAALMPLLLYFNITKFLLLCQYVFFIL